MKVERGVIEGNGKTQNRKIFTVGQVEDRTTFKPATGRLTRSVLNKTEREAPRYSRDSSSLV